MENWPAMMHFKFQSIFSLRQHKNVLPGGIKTLLQETQKVTCIHDSTPESQSL